MNYKITYSRHRDLWLVVNNVTNQVHSWWESEAEALGSMHDLNRWAANDTALKQNLPNNVIPFRNKKVAKSG